MRVSMAAIIDRAGWNFNVDEADGVSRRDRRRGGGVCPWHGQMSNPSSTGSHRAQGYARRTAINPVGKGERADRPDGLLGGRRHGGGNRSISEIPVKWPRGCREGIQTRPMQPRGTFWTPRHGRPAERRTPCRSEASTLWSPEGREGSAGASRSSSRRAARGWPSTITSTRGRRRTRSSACASTAPMGSSCRPTSRRWTTCGGCSPR